MIFSNDGDVLYYDKVKGLDNYIKRYVYGTKVIKNTKRIEYYNISSSFDIETTSFYEGEEKRAIMYEWTFGINGLVIIGRYWNEFIDLCNRISMIMGLNEKKKLIVYIHNLSFEFQFICKRFNWLNVFATDDRKPLYALCDIGIEFRCSYLLSGFSLAKVGEHLQKYKISKLSGEEFNYKLLRNSKTVLSAKEYQYCINDVRVVMSYIQELIEQYGNITKLPLTKTGFVREFVKKKCFHKDVVGESNKPNNKKLRYKYINLMANLTMNESTYKLAKRCFMGGFTHASILNSGCVFEKVHSYDFTSSYPYVMISNQFPMSEGEMVQVNSKEEYEKYSLYYLCAFDCEIVGLENKVIYEHYIPSSKCFEKEDYIVDNGRIISAKRIKISLTNIDFDIVKRFYTWKSIRFSNFYIFRKEYLPKEIILAVLDLYESKTKLKGVEDMEKEYNDKKEMLNSCYGMAVTDIAKNQSTYCDDMWQVKVADLETLLERYNKSKSRFLYYWWGIFIPAYARRNLFYGINELKEDFIYADTDSLKFTNLENHKHFFDNYNKQVETRLKEIMNKLGIDFNKCKPKTIQGKEKLIGVFDYEGMYDLFKTLGAKRYMYVKDNKLSITISGVNKKNAVPYLIDTYKTFDNIFNAFNDGLVIPKNATGKQIHTYIDYEIKGTLVDYQGNSCEYDEFTSTHLEETEYSLSISEDYKRLLFGIKEVKM